MTMFLGILALIVLSSLFLSSQFALYFPGINRSIWNLIVVILIFGSLFSMVGLAVATAPIKKFIYQASSILVGFFLYFLLSCLLVQFIELFYPLTVDQKGISSVALTIPVIIFGIWNAWYPRIHKVDIKIQGLASPIRAVQLSDIHLGNFRGKNFLSNIVRKVVELQPDIIFNTGDLFDGRSQLNSDTLSPFSKIDVPHYFIEGNHDLHVGVNHIYSIVNNFGIITLTNEVAYFKDLQIIGLRYMVADDEHFDMHSDSKINTVKSVLERLAIDKQKPSILLHHTPNGIKYAFNHNVNLMLAGHTHAGQMWPLTYIAKMIFGYNQGLYSYKDLSIYVSQGIGTVFTPMRIGTSSEITFLNLIPDE